MSTQLVDRDSHLHRLTMLCDGVFAIAITLLAIELHPPEGWNGGTEPLLDVLGPRLIAYAVSFAVIGIYWISHRRAFMSLVRADLVLDILSLLFLALLALLPAATSLLYEHASQSTVLIYIGLVACIGFAHALAWGYAAFVGNLVRADAPLVTRLFVFFASGILPGAMCALSFASIYYRSPWGWIGMTILGALAAFGPVLLPKPAPSPADA